MLSNKLKATVLRWSELAWNARVQIKAWAKLSKTFSHFDVQTFENPLLKVAAVTDANGNSLVYCPVQTCFLVNAFIVAPSATPDEATQAGDKIDSMLEREALRAGVSSMLIMVPDGHPALKDNPEWADFKTVKVYERKFPLAVNSGGIRLSSPSHVSNFLN